MSVHGPAPSETAGFRWAELGVCVFWGVEISWAAFEEQGEGDGEEGEGGGFGGGDAGEGEGGVEGGRSGAADDVGADAEPVGVEVGVADPGLEVGGEGGGAGAGDGAGGGEPVEVSAGDGDLGDEEVVVGGEVEGGGEGDGELDFGAGDGAFAAGGLGGEGWMPLRTELRAVKEALRVEVEKVMSAARESRSSKATSEGELVRVGTVMVREVLESLGKTR